MKLDPRFLKRIDDACASVNVFLTVIAVGLGLLTLVFAVGHAVTEVSQRPLVPPDQDPFRRAAVAEPVRPAPTVSSAVW